MSQGTIKRVFIIIGIVFTILWFLGILGLHVYKEIFLAPVFRVIGDYKPEKLELKEPHRESEPFYLMGLQLKFPFLSQDINLLNPVFRGHHLSTVAILIEDKRSIKKGTVLIDTFPDTDENLKGFSFKKTISWFSPEMESYYEFKKATLYVRVADFSWWNLIYDIRLIFYLTFKAMMTPPAYKNMNSYDLETPYLKGILIEGKAENGSISEFIFVQDKKYYSITLINQEPEKIKDMIASIKVIDKTEERATLKDKSAYPEELILLSEMSMNGATAEKLEQLINVMESKNYKADIVNRIRKEIEYLQEPSKSD